MNLISREPSFLCDSTKGRGSEIFQVRPIEFSMGSSQSYMIGSQLGAQGSAFRYEGMSVCISSRNETEE